MPVILRLVVVVATVAMVSVACGNGETSMPDSPESAVDPTTTASSIAAPTTAEVAAVAPTEPPTTTPEPTFTSDVDVVTAEDIGAAWRENCPVPVTKLRLLSLLHWGDDGRVANGALVVHEDHAEDIVAVFAQLFEAQFPVHTMRPITEFGGDDDASMTANNTSAFNCREIDGRPGVWSQHAYGGAIDINPLVNPWVRGDRVDPPEGAAYVDRDPAVTGLIVAGDIVTTAFAEIGWGWGGDWTTTLDYQHFSHNGR
ncbi:MAG: hypothetical protein ACI9C1_000890 [Candidatus Aldehydirespiratoraceae bacterium]